MGILTNKEKEVLAGHREILWLKRQIEQLEKEDEFVEPEIAEEADEENIKNGVKMYRSHINSMRVQLDLATLRNKNKEEIAKAIDEHYFTIKSLYTEPSDPLDRQIKKVTNDSIDQRDELVSRFMRALKELNENELELTNLQQETIKRHLENREILRRTFLLQEEIDSIPITERTSELHELVKEQKNYIATIRGVLSVREKIYMNIEGKN
ncbi:hypothetical protein EDC94DRAFT_366797 [Helicostylum pulchrum]|nr:hypothetical protein EDC94DRAFT_366797 [Helicostylum pulchrum]